jgi:outer membrane receptor protein involved in Fe transport
MRRCPARRSSAVLVPLLALHAALASVAAAQAPVPAPARPAARDTTARRDTTQRLPVIEVLGSVLPSAGPAVGSGVPARISLVSGEAIDGWEPRLLSDALASQPGISLYDDLGSPFKPTLVTRGFTASPVVGLPQGVSVFLDGVPVNEPDAGQVNFDLLPLEHVRRVELLSGTASLLGPNSLGGAINLVTQRGDGAPSGEVELSGGSYDRFSGEGSLSGDARGWRYYVGGGHERERGWRQLTSARLSNGFVNAGRYGARRGGGIQAFVASSDVQTAGSLPASLRAARPDSNLSAGDFEALRQLHVAAHGYAQLAGGRGSARAWLRRHTAERFNVNQIDDPDVRGFSRNRTLGASLDWERARALGAGTLGLRLGGGGSLNSVGIRLFAERIDPGQTTDVESPIGKLDAYALSDYRLGRATLSGGLRYDVVRVPFRNRLRPERDTTSTFRRVSPRGGVSVDVARGLSLYASAGQSFRAPAVIELACADPEEPCPLPFALGDDPPLDPVVATTYEIGGQLARGPLVLSASAYRTAVRDDIFLFPYVDEDEPEGSTIDGYFANIARTRREGGELASRLLLSGGHSLYANYAVTRATFQTRAEIFSIREAEGGENETEPGDRLPLVPAQTLAVGGTLALPSRLQAGADLRYTGERWLRGDEANETSPLGGYWTADLRAGYALGPWELQAVVRNVLDRRYDAFGGFNIDQGSGGALERFLTPGMPRTVQVVVRRGFGVRDER